MARRLPKVGTYGKDSWIFTGNNMSKIDNAAQLELARQGATRIAEGLGGVIQAGNEAATQFAALVEQFTRLADKEQRQIAAGKLGAKHGAKGGAPAGNRNAAKKKERP